MVGVSTSSEMDDNIRQGRVRTFMTFSIVLSAVAVATRCMSKPWSLARTSASFLSVASAVNSSEVRNIA